MSGNTDGPNITWKAIAAVATTVTIASLTALIVVATVTESDALTTLALALASLSFTSQIIIFIIDTWASSQQLSRAEDLNRQTISMIGDIKSGIERTRDMVGENYRTALDAALEKRIVEADKRGDEVDPAAAALLRDLAPRVPPMVDLVGTDMDESLRVLTSWPEEAEAQEVVAIYSGLDTTTKRALAFAAYDEIISRRFGGEIGLTAMTMDDGLVAAGLARIESRDGADVLVLTSLGRAVGRLAVAPDPPPPYLGDADLVRWSDLASDDDPVPDE